MYYIIELIRGHVTGKNNPQKEAELKAWLGEDPGRFEFFRSVCVGDERRKEEYARINEKEALRRFDHMIGYRRAVSFRRWVLYAAGVIIPVMIAVLLLWQGKPEKEDPRQVVLAPGKKQAMLVLATGENVLLQSRDSLREITQCEGVKVMNKEGSLVYMDSAGLALAEQYNVLMTPRGGEYQVTLTDGTMVWLNADSRLKYPVAFDPVKREVYLVGEAYFEVAKDSARPFYVVTDEVKVRVYGTEFNVNTHHKGMVRTTLVRGSVGVMVMATGMETVLKPDQMLEYDPVTMHVGVKTVDVYNFVAWKYGEFVFENERLEDIMEQLQSWYDVEVFYASEEVKNLRFTGDATRFTEVRYILNILEKTGNVVFSMNGKTITVHGKE